LPAGETTLGRAPTSGAPPVDVFSVGRRTTAAGGVAAVDRRVTHSSRRGEELEGDAVGVAEAEPGSVVGVDDAAVGDVEPVEMITPGLQGGAVGASEREVVEPGAQFAEGAGIWGGVLVKADECPADGVDGVVEASVGGFVEDRFGAEERLVPGSANCQVLDRQGDVADGWEVRHGLLLGGRW